MSKRNEVEKKTSQSHHLSRFYRTSREQTVTVLKMETRITRFVYIIPSQNKVRYRDLNKLLYPL